MSPKLKPLLLPQLVEERRKRESESDAEMDLSSTYFYSQSSSNSIPSPVTPTFSSRGHMRYPSSASSIESPFHSTIADSPSSPTFVPKPGRRSLPDVQEEPHDERDQDLRDQDFDMFADVDDDLYDCLCDDLQCPHRDNSRSQSSVQLSTNPGFDYDITDGFFSDGELSVSPRSKKRRAVDPPVGFATRFENRFPSFSRKWRSRKPYESPSVIHTSELTLENTTSGNTSNRSSVSNSKYFEHQMPPTPTKSIFGSRENLAPLTTIDIERANRGSADVEEKLATTPLLPPLMIDASANIKQATMQSPLQSPTVAETSDSFSGAVTPIDSITTPQLFGIPSPPLSTKPSISSFHRVTLNRPSQLVASSEIPGINLGDPVDEWSHKLGHANFNIHPEPYVPEVFDLEACRQLRANWDLARCNYTKHLVRTGEHYGVTSNTYKHTQEKWTAMELKWKYNNDLTIANTVDNSSDPFATLKHTTLGDAGNNNIMSKLPSLNDTRFAGKFPLLGDEDIVGPMVRATSQLQRCPSKKAKFYKFLVEKFPIGLSGKS